MPVPLGKTIAGRGKPFACKACGTAIVLPKLGFRQSAMAASGVIGAMVLGAASIIPIVALLGAVDWATTPVLRAR